MQHKLREVLEECLKSLQTVNVLKSPWLNLKNRCSPIKVKPNDSVSGQVREEEKLVNLDIKNYGGRNLVLFLEGEHASQEFWLKTQTSLNSVKVSLSYFHYFFSSTTYWPAAVFERSIGPTLTFERLTLKACLSLVSPFTDTG